MTKTEINFFYLKSKFSHIWSIRIKNRVVTLRLDKTSKLWRPKFITYKLEYLDLLGLYYESGLLKYERNEN
jgi:hypothetical protein